MRIIRLVMLVVAIVGVSCQQKKARESHFSKNSIQENLLKIKGKGFLFGHQDDLAYGINWKYVEGGSDVKAVSGDYPALFGWELGGLEIGNSVNLDSVPFDTMRKLAVWANQNGGVNTFSWHPYNVINGSDSWNTDVRIVEHVLQKGSHHQSFIGQLDILAEFLGSLKTVNKNPIPFIFRPWHEMDGSWFWWGNNHCTPEQFKELFQFTIHYLRDVKGLTQMVVAYSPDCNFTSTNEYLSWYPGDEWVDILGMDNYHDFKVGGDIDKAISKMHVVIDAAHLKNKFCALTETGLENVTDSLWFTTKLGRFLNDSVIKKNISYLMLWRSDPKVHFFFSYPDHPSAPDAINFLSQSEVLLLSRFNQLTK